MVEIPTLPGIRNPAQSKALVDGPQALTLDELPLFIEDVRIVREAYEKRLANVRSN